MNNKFLPIGSICTLKGKNKKVMITGFYSVEFNGNLKINDYSGCAYPEGLLLPEFTCTFNHQDIEKVNFVGYQDDDQDKFQKLLRRLTGDSSDSSSDNYKNDDWVLSSNEAYSKLLFDENGVVVLAETVEQEKEKSEIRFDENGIAVSETKEAVTNPFYKDYSSVETVEAATENNIFNNYKFDENGILIDDGSSFDSKKETSLNKIEFDENGIVISSNNDLLEKNNTKYSFDENGILVSVEGEAEVPVSNESIVENNVEVSSKENNESQYKFDENGILVSLGETVDANENISTNEELEKTVVNDNHELDEEISS